MLSVSKAEPCYAGLVFQMQKKGGGGVPGSYLYFTGHAFNF